MERLVAAVQELSMAHSLEQVMAVVRRAARELTGADGATFVLREHDMCHYLDENAIGPLWKGRRFPMSTCISGWAMLHRRPAVVPDIFVDDRIPIDAYRPTFVKSLVMVPIRASAPIGAIGNYWAAPHAASAEEVRLLQALADSTSVSLENVRLYRELEQRLRNSEDSVRARDEFIAVASHELRTPLTALRLQLQSLRKALEAGASPRVVDNTERAIASTGRLAGLVEVLLDASAISLQGLPLQKEVVDLAALAREAPLRFREQAQRANCVLTVRAPDRVEGIWDRARIEQVLDNLLSNALKYAAGAPVAIAVEQSDSAATLSVQDAGPGIPDADVTRIFERFERAAPVRSYSGFGLGLYLVRSIVDAHGGSIRAQSVAGKGSRFIVELPKIQEDAPEDACPVPSSRSTPADG